MIESITIAKTASYGTKPAVLTDLRRLNFLFGANATGKTTITRVIADAKDFPACAVTWKDGARIETIVFNRDFVERNFNQPTELKGVFTLGEKNIDILNKIAAAKSEVDESGEKIAKLTVTLNGGDGSGGQQGELAKLEANLKKACWSQKQKHDETFSGAFEGFRNNAERFKGKILQERKSNSATLRTLEELERRAETVFGSNHIVEEPIPSIETTAILDHESSNVLTKRVFGKEDVDIAEMIRRLEDSDWVREGRVFYENNDGSCPFCQQKTPAAFADSLNDYFDEAFERDNAAIDAVVRKYKTDSERIRTQVDSVLESPSTFLDVEGLKQKKALLGSNITINIQRLDGKKKEPSRIVRLESLVSVTAAIESLIDAANVKIATHNALVANLTKERSDLTAQMWKYLVSNELDGTLTGYDSQRANATKAIEGITRNIEAATNRKTKKVAEIRELEKETMSIQPTIDSINAVLSSFGFRSFSLAKASSGTSYKLIRSDGSDAKDTLSEGERAFVSFLYFYSLVKGSESDSGITSDRVVVFDDPVSSLDSDVLFIVSNLIRGVFEEVRTGNGYVKQVFVLTHNVYFHKEVTFNPRRSERALSDETFWVVRRPSQESEVVKHESNPVKTSYELLWDELRMADRSSTTIQNTMRRILESYFTILGKLDFDEICERFEGQEKQICKSLFSWVQAGSHSILDDLYVSIDESQIAWYRKVFANIFTKLGHSAHYSMMMRNDQDEKAAVDALNQTGSP